jgi:hypothetical protein
MGGSLKFGEEEVRVKSEFDGEGKVLIRDTPTSTVGRTPTIPVFWEGWAWAEKTGFWYSSQEDEESWQRCARTACNCPTEEDLRQGNAKETLETCPKPKKGWLDSGQWKRADVLATSFNEKFRWYEVPKHHVVKAIILEREDRIVMKILTREAQHKERLVTGKPSEKGIIEYARFTQTGPQRVFPSRPPF